MSRAEKSRLVFCFILLSLSGNLKSFLHESQKILSLFTELFTSPADAPVNKFLAFSRKWAHLPKETNCIHCGRCTNACPLGLSAKEIVQAYHDGNVELLQELNADLCMSCGTCSFVCPAKRPLAPSIALAKIMMKNGGKK